VADPHTFAGGGVLGCIDLAHAHAFLRVCCASAAYADHALRLCEWDGELQGLPEAEVKLYGIYAQTESRFMSLTAFLETVTHALATAEKHAAQPADAPSAERGVVTPASVVHELRTLLQATVRATAFTVLTVSSAASVAWRLCGDPHCAIACIRASNRFMPVLVKHVDDPHILQQYLQRLLDLLTATLMYGDHSDAIGFGVLGVAKGGDQGGGKPLVLSNYRPADLTGAHRDRVDDGGAGRSGAHSSSSSSRSGGGGAGGCDGVAAADHFQSNAELRVLIFTVGSEIVRQSRRVLTSTADDLVGPAQMVYFESVFRAYVSIFLASLALDESDLLSKFGYTVEKLLVSTNDVLTSISDRMHRQSCGLMSTHTIVSLHGIAEGCMCNMKRFPDCTAVMFAIVRSCRLILWGCSNRYVLAKMYLEHIVDEVGCGVRRYRVPTWATPLTRRVRPLHPLPFRPFPSLRRPSKSPQTIPSTRSTSCCSSTRPRW
jgi:hypothetical protein